MSQTLVPRSSDAISRPRLKKVLDTIPQKKLTLVMAGPGYGKTTLMAQAMEHFNLRFIWYRPDSADTGFMGFFRQLVIGIREYWPGFWKARETDGLVQIPEDEFLTELSTQVTSDLFLVMDDCHSFAEKPAICHFLQLLLDLFFPFLHLVLIGRSPPGLKLSRLMADRQVSQIMEEDLAFTRDEIRHLFAQLFDIVLPEPCLNIWWPCATRDIWTRKF